MMISMMNRSIFPSIEVNSSAESWRVVLTCDPSLFFDNYEIICPGAIQYNDDNFLGNEDFVETEGR